jgi:hypothetical protein
LDDVDYVGEDLLGVMEKIRVEWKLKPNINAMFLTLIPKSDYMSSFDDFRAIALCNCLYKILSKFITLRLKPLLSNYILQEQFGFLRGGIIHEVIGLV